MEIKTPMERARLEYLLDWLWIPYTFRTRKDEILAEFDMQRAAIFELEALNRHLTNENEALSRMIKKLLDSPLNRYLTNENEAISRMTKKLLDSPPEK